MDDRIRASDADRDRVTARLREHFAARLNSDELDERISAALHAKTFGDLRQVMTDLPEPGLTPWAAQRPVQAAPHWVAQHRRGPRVLPLILLGLIAMLLIPGSGWFLFAFLQLVLMFWLVVGLAGLIVASRFRRRGHRHWGPGASQHWPGPGPWR